MKSYKQLLKDAKAGKLTEADKKRIQESIDFWNTAHQIEADALKM